MTRRGFFGLLPAAPLALTQKVSTRRVEPKMPTEGMKVPIEGIYPETLVSSWFDRNQASFASEWDAYERAQWRYYEGKPWPRS